MTPDANKNHRAQLSVLVNGAKTTLAQTAGQILEAIGKMPQSDRLFAEYLEANVVRPMQQLASDEVMTASSAREIIDGMYEAVNPKTLVVSEGGKAVGADGPLVPLYLEIRKKLSDQSLTRGLKVMYVGDLPDGPLSGAEEAAAKRFDALVAGAAERYVPIIAPGQVKGDTLVQQGTVRL